MCGVVSEMISPSVRRTSRKTPWVLGCCGPMLTSISSVRTSNSTMVGSCRGGAVMVAIDLAHGRTRRRGRNAFSSYPESAGLLNQPLGILLRRDWDFGLFPFQEAVYQFMRFAQRYS